jgi:hypothetical protein
MWSSFLVPHREYLLSTQYPDGGSPLEIKVLWGGAGAGEPGTLQVPSSTKMGFDAKDRYPRM